MGKTSLLVKFDTGKFQSGNFSATVGIGFTVGVQLGLYYIVNSITYKVCTCLEFLYI